MAFSGRDFVYNRFLRKKTGMKAPDLRHYTKKLEEEYHLIEGRRDGK